ncbi:MAG: hypothetical protein H7Y18_16295 [Clostridiaceae bacterium]|nr:hypothetical protein [Clostridiaceae bacterium]
MENGNEFKEEFDKCFEAFQKLVTHSFEKMQNDPHKKDEVIDLWKTYILKFKVFTYKTSEMYNNKDVFKAITKALMFGKKTGGI